MKIIQKPYKTWFFVIRNCAVFSIFYTDHMIHFYYVKNQYQKRTKNVFTFFIGHCLHYILTYGKKLPKFARDKYFHRIRTLLLNQHKATTIESRIIHARIHELRHSFSLVLEKFFFILVFIFLVVVVCLRLLLCQII